MKDVLVALWMPLLAEHLLKPCFEECLHKHKSVFTGAERHADRIQTSLPFALQRTGAAQVETLAVC